MEEAATNKRLNNTSITYRCCQLSSDQITTIILGGGGVYGFLYLGLIKFLEEQDLLKNIQQVIGVSVGSMVSLYLALGYNYEEIYKSVMYDIDLGRILEINADNIFNILDQLGINNGAYVEETIKNIIAAKGLSPYLTFKDLAGVHLGPELNIGYTRSFHNDFFVANRQTTPDMPVWLAVRASIAIPVILTPVLDFAGSQDILCDGGLINNTPIKWYLEDWWNKNPTAHKNCVIQQRYNKDVATQTQLEDNMLISNAIDDIISDANSDKQKEDLVSRQQDQQDQQQQKEDIASRQKDQQKVLGLGEKIEQHNQPKKKFRQHFWCCDIKTTSENPISCPDDLKKITLPIYLSWVIQKIFSNQDFNRCKYAQYLYQLDAKDYPEINRVKFDLDMPTRKIIISRTYENYKKYYENYLVMPS